MTFKLHLLTQLSSGDRNSSLCAATKETLVVRNWCNLLTMRKSRIYPICFGTGHGYRFTPKSSNDVEIVCKLLSGTYSSRSMRWQQSWRNPSFLPWSAGYTYRAIEEITYISTAKLLQRNHGESSSFWWTCLSPQTVPLQQLRGQNTG